MSTETGRPHRRSIRELRDTGWSLAEQGHPREGLKYLREARRLEAQEARRIESMKSKADRNAGISRNK